MEIRIDPQADALLKRLNGAGFAAYVVGGCVRDSILKRPAHDWDITTDALPQQLLALFSQEHCVTDGLKHGTVTVIRGGVPYEITSSAAGIGAAECFASGGSCAAGFYCQCYGIFA